MPVLTIRARTVSYEDYGSGPVALLIHGSPGTAKSWARVGERLPGRYRVIAPDLPGYGETTLQAADGQPDVSYASELIEALVRQVGVPVVTAGHSYGGVVALNLALRGNAPVGALALFEPVAVPILAISGEWDVYTKAKAVFDGYVTDVERGNDSAVQLMVDF